MPVKVIPAGRSCSPCGGRRLDRLWCQKISGSLPHDMINLITLHINLNWFPIVTVTAPCTVPRHVRDLSQTSWGGGHYLDVETRLGGIYQGSMFCLDCWGTANHLKRRVLTFRSFEPLLFPSTVWLTAMESHLTLLVFRSPVALVTTWCESLTHSQSIQAATIAAYWRLAVKWFVLSQELLAGLWYFLQGDFAASAGRFSMGSFWPPASSFTTFSKSAAPFTSLQFVLFLVLASHSAALLGGCTVPIHPAMEFFSDMLEGFRWVVSCPRLYIALYRISTAGRTGFPGTGSEGAGLYWSLCQGCQSKASGVFFSLSSRSRNSSLAVPSKWYRRKYTPSASWEWMAHLASNIQSWIRRSSMTPANLHSEV